MEKTRLIKNLSCIGIAVTALAVFLIFRFTSQGALLPYVMPFVMFEALLGCFSLYWSIVKDNRETMLNIGLILFTMILALGYIIADAVYVVLNNSSGLNITTDIFLIAVSIMAAACMIYPVFLDIGFGKAKAKKA
jgi:hypothetical protein